MVRPSRTRSEGKKGKTKVWTADAATAVVRYQVRDVDASVAFYGKRLGFELTAKPGPLAIVSRGDLHLLLSGTHASGGRPVAGGEEQRPGGWNRIVLYVDDLDVTIAALEKAKARFRNQVETGPGGRQILLDDPDGNPIELHEPPKPRAGDGGRSASSRGSAAPRGKRPRGARSPRSHAPGGR